MSIEKMNAAQLKRECDRRGLAHGTVGPMRLAIVQFDRSNPVLGPYPVITAAMAEQMPAQRLHAECTARGIQSRGLFGRFALKYNLGNAEMREAIAKFDAKCIKQWCVTNGVYRDGMTVQQMVEEAEAFMTIQLPLRRH